MALDPLLIELLVCPKDKLPLWYLEEDALLYNPRLRLAYPIRDGIPVLLIEEADQLDEAAHQALAAHHEAAPVTTGLGDVDPRANQDASSSEDAPGSETE